MPENRINILSTRPLAESLHLKAAGMEIDIFSFIDTRPVTSDEVRNEIERLSQQVISVVFTSMSAVENVVKNQPHQLNAWRIYCIGNTTKQLVKKHFGNRCIAGTAPSAAQLAALISDDKEIKEIYFFCGDQRRDELPEILRLKNIIVHEIVVYNTIATPHQITKQYKGILFFSPSAVESFFRNNTLNEHSILFAIGSTTAMEIEKYSNNKIIVADAPGKEELIMKMIAYFS